MPQINFQEIKYKPPKTLVVDWNTWRGGLNTLLRQTEIKDDELAQADNLILVGRGVPTKRPGSDNYFLTGSSVATGAQQVRGLKSVNFASGVTGVAELLALTDEGLLTKKSGASYTIIPGASYVSGYNAEMVQIFNSVYVVNGVDTLTKYNGVSIAQFVQISKPTTVRATNLSGVSGTFTKSFRVSAFNDVGETLASDAVLISNTPQDLADTTIRLSWTTSSPASEVAGYAIYGVEQGDERLITTTDSTSLTFDYKGIPDPSELVFTPEADTTEGPVARHIITYKDKLVVGNVVGFPSRVQWSGGGVNIDKFNWRYGGGYIDIDRDSGDKITGLIEFQEKVVVFKERSIWEMTLASSDGIVIPTVKLVIRGIGTVSSRTIRHVENDVFFLTRRGVYSLGNEANYLANVLRTNEISAKVRPSFDSLTPSQLQNATSIYHDNKYRIAFPTGSSAKNSAEIIYDRERLAWMGKNTYPAYPSIYEVHYDTDNSERLVWGDADDNYVTEMSDGYSNDKGVKIQTTLLTKKSSFDGIFKFKQVKSVYTNWRNVFGSPFVNVILETRDGAVGSAESFTITASNAGVGWGFDRWGTFKWGTSSGAGDARGSNDLVRRTRINKAARTVQLEITTTGSNDKYELLAAQLRGQELGEGIIPSSWDTA